MASAGRILMFPVGNWILGNDYGILDIVYHEGSSYIAKNNIINSTTPPPDDPTNWQIHARGFGADALSEISAEDTSGVLGTTGAVVASQDLLDAIADKVMTKLIPYTNIANNFLATDTKTVLSGPMGKSLKDQLDTTNSNLSVIGNVYSSNPPSYVPCETGTHTEITSLILPAGVYEISACFSWSTTTRGGSRTIEIRKGDFYNSPFVAGYATTDLVNDASALYQSTSGIISITESTKIKLWANQKSGSNLSVDSYATLIAVRLK